MALVIGTQFQGVLAQSPSESSPPKDLLYQYMWDNVFKGDSAATGKNLKDIARFYEGLPATNQTQIQKAFRSTGFSEQEKLERIEFLAHGYHNGMVVTREGDTYEGIFLMSFSDKSSGVDSFLVFEGTGEDRIPIRDVAEISPSGQEKGCTLKLKSGQGRVDRQNTAFRHLYFVSGEKEVVLTCQQIHRIVLGGRQAVECQQCHRIMQQGWVCCPYDGKPIGVKGK